MADPLCLGILSKSPGRARKRRQCVCVRDRRPPAHTRISQILQNVTFFDHSCEFLKEQIKGIIIRESNIGRIRSQTRSRHNPENKETRATWTGAGEAANTSRRLPFVHPARSTRISIWSDTMAATAALVFIAEMFTNLRPFRPSIHTVPSVHTSMRKAEKWARAIQRVSERNGQITRERENEVYSTNRLPHAHVRNQHHTHAHAPRYMLTCRPPQTDLCAIPLVLAAVLSCTH